MYQNRVLYLLYQCIYIVIVLPIMYLYGVSYCRRRYVVGRQPGLPVRDKRFVPRGTRLSRPVKGFNRMNQQRASLYIST